MQAYQEQFPPQQQTNYMLTNYSNHEVSPWSLPPVHNHHIEPNHHPVHPIIDPFFITPPLSSFTSMFNRRVPQFAYDGSSSSHEYLLGQIINSEPVVHCNRQPGSVGPFGLGTEVGKMSVEEIKDAKALAASKSHSEAERRRRERINNHLAKLRSLLPCTTKTDKATLLAEVVQQLKDLKRQTSIIKESTPLPTEIDELTVNRSDENGKFIIKVSLCCEDRSDLLHDLIEALKSLRLRTLKADITTLGGRVKNVLFITGEENNYKLNEHSLRCSDGDSQTPLSCIEEALKAVMEPSLSGSVKNGKC